MLHAKQTRAPTIMTGFLPIRSASFPLKGLESIAVRVNNDIINPLYAAPPSEVRKKGNSGMIMLKLAKNRNELAQRSQNLVEYVLAGWIVFTERLPHHSTFDKIKGELPGVQE